MFPLESCFEKKKKKRQGEKKAACIKEHSSISIWNLPPWHGYVAQISFLSVSPSFWEVALPGLDVGGKEKDQRETRRAGHSSFFGKNMKGTLDHLGELGEAYHIVGSRLEFEVLLIRRAAGIRKVCGFSEQLQPTFFIGVCCMIVPKGFFSPGPALCSPYQPVMEKWHATISVPSHTVSDPGLRAAGNLALYAAWHRSVFENLPPPPPPRNSSSFFFLRNSSLSFHSMLARPVPISGDILQGFLLSFIHHSQRGCRRKRKNAWLNFCRSFLVHSAADLALRA